MASTFRAAALRKIAPKLVGFTTSSKMAILFAFPQISSTLGRGLRRMAASIPRVNLYPVSFVNTSNSAV